MAAIPQVGPLEVLLIVAVCAVGTALIFSRRGRHPAGGFFVGLVLGPLGVALALLLLPPTAETNRLNS